MATDASAVFPNFAPGQTGSVANRFSGSFPDPYLDYASTAMPRSIYDVLRWCEYVWLNFGTYRMAAQRVVRYFLTKIELTDASDDEKEKYEDFLENQIKALDVLATSGDNFMCYGQDFLSLHIPFRRHLRCPKCKVERPMKQMTGEYSWDDFKFKSRCRQCSFEGEFERVDRNTIESDPIRVIHWPPQEMRLLYHPLTAKTVYMWEIPGSFKHMIKTGNTFYLENTAWEVIEAIKENKIFRFNEDVIYHLKEESIAGLKNYGWGIPLIMSNFKLAWYLQVLKRFNEAIALDYLMPFRAIVPTPGTSRDADPVLHQNLGDFYSHVMAAIKKHRKDPATWHAFPFAVELKQLSGDGTKLAPIELMEKGTDEFLNAQGVPAELYRGSLQVQAAPVALRLFERTWVHLVSGLNGELNWLFKRFSELKNWENLKGRLQPTQMAYDIEDRNIRLQLSAGQQVSQQTALSPFGIDYRDEIRRMLEEEKFKQEEQMRFQQEQSQKQELQSVMAAGAQGQIPGIPGQPPQGQPGQPGADPNAQGGAPAGGDPNAPMAQPQASPSQMVAQMGTNISMDDMVAQSDQIAQILVTMPYELRRGELNKIKKSNETFHSLVIAKMQKTRDNAKTQGGFQLLQQAAGQGQ